MLIKFENWLPIVGIVIIVLIFILFLPFLLVAAILIGVFPSKEATKFKADYANWLSKHEGEEFFCYTSKRSSVEEVEIYAVPTFDESVHVIKLVGKERPQTNLDERFVSHSLSNLKNRGFPNIMIIVNGEIYDLSIHSSVYDAINQKKLTELPKLVQQAFDELRNNLKGLI